MTRRAACLLLALLVGWTAHADETNHAADGWIDLRDWRPEADGPVRLDGTWDFFWRDLVPPDGTDIDTSKAVPIEVPRFWHRTVIGPDGETAGRGFGSYRLRIRLPDASPPLALRLGNVNTAVEVFVQGRSVLQAGHVSSERQSARPGYRPGVALIPPLDALGNPQTLDLVVHVSSFESARGGLDDPVWLGTPDDLIADRERALAFVGLVGGGLTVLGLYHLLLFVLRRRARVELYLGLLCLFTVGRLAVSNELLLMEFWPTIPWPWLVRGMYFFAYGIFGAFTLYLEELWPRTVSRVVYWGLLAVSVLGCLTSLVLPVHVFARGIALLEAYVVACIVIAFLVYLRALKRRREGVGIYAGGFAVAAAGASYDVAVSQGWIAGALYLGPIGMFVFLLAQSAILARRFTRSLTTVERQRGELQDLIELFERERRERQRYEELSLAASGLAHETKNPLGIIRGLAQRLVTAPDTADTARRSARQILDEADRAVSRLGDFLSYARLRDPRPEAVEVGALLRYAAEILAPDLEAKSIPCTVEMEPVEAEPVECDPVRVVADREMLLQIVLNLMLNSIAASDAGEALILAFERNAANGAGRLVIEDHGTGIATDRLDDVRKPYVTGRADGHGLGLALVDRLVELHGWRLEIQSTLGVGTRVEIHGLEIAPETPEAQSAQSSPQSSP